MTNTTLSRQIKILIFSAALLIRAVFVLAQYRFGVITGAFVSGDSKLYIDIAGNVLSGNGFAFRNEPTAFVSPGFPLFLATCFKIFGENPLWTSLFQCVLSALVCVFIASTAAIVFGRRAGIVAGIVAAGYYELVLWTSGQILTEPLYTFLLAAAVYSLVRATVSDNALNREFALAGLLFGLAALVRPLALPVALCLGLLMLGGALLSHKRRPRKPLIFIAACLLVMQPWGLRNYLTLDHYTLLSTEGGHVFWLGNNPEYDLYEHPDFTRYGGYTVMFKPPPELGKQVYNKSEPESNRVYAGEARRHIFNQPQAFFTRALHKTWNMWRPTFGISSFQNKLISYSFYPLLLLLSLAGIYLAWRRKTIDTEKSKIFARLTEPIGLLTAFLLVHLAMHAVINGEIRFRVPLWIALIPFSAFALVLISERFARKPAGEHAATPNS